MPVVKGLYGARNAFRFHAMRFQVIHLKGCKHQVQRMMSMRCTWQLAKRLVVKTLFHLLHYLVYAKAGGFHAWREFLEGLQEIRRTRNWAA